MSILQACVILLLLIHTTNSINTYDISYEPNGEIIWRSTSDFTPQQSQSYGEIRLGQVMSIEFDFIFSGRNSSYINQFFRIGATATTSGCTGQESKYPSMWLKYGGGNTGLLDIQFSGDETCTTKNFLNDYGALNVDVSHHIKISLNNSNVEIIITGGGVGKISPYIQSWPRDPTPKNILGNYVSVWWMGDKYSGTYDPGLGTFSNIIIKTNIFTFAPTMAPTIKPTKSPTITGYIYPTMYPTTNPTQFPTTNMPTSITSNPTQIPTVTTINPTKIPTIIPTITPTSNPTRNPTRNPTPAPTLNPTTLHPTGDSTDDPTGDPTADPTRDPTVDPTSDPTANPTTSNPTSNPTTNPTSNPTIPSKSPTNTRKGLWFQCIYKDNDVTYYVLSLTLKKYGKVMLNAILSSIEFITTASINYNETQINEHSTWKRGGIFEFKICSIFTDIILNKEDNCSAAFQFGLKHFDAVNAHDHRNDKYSAVGTFGIVADDELTEYQKYIGNIIKSESFKHNFTNKINIALNNITNQNADNFKAVLCQVMDPQNMTLEDSTDKQAMPGSGDTGTSPVILIVVVLVSLLFINTILINIIIYYKKKLKKVNNVKQTEEIQIQQTEMHAKSKNNVDDVVAAIDNTVKIEHDENMMNDEKEKDEILFSENLGENELEMDKILKEENKLNDAMNLDDNELDRILETESKTDNENDDVSLSLSIVKEINQTVLLEHNEIAMSFDKTQSFHFGETFSI